MTPADLERVADSFARFHATCAPLFGQRPARTRSEQYLRALLVQCAERRNAENLAEAVAGATPAPCNASSPTRPGMPAG